MEDNRLSGRVGQRCFFRRLLQPVSTAFPLFYTHFKKVAGDQVDLPQAHPEVALDDLVPQLSKVAGGLWNGQMTVTRGDSISP